MRKLILILLSLSFSLVMYSQTTADAVKRMNNGQYDVAKTYWEALNDNYNSYGAKISLCNACIVLQKEAKSLVSKQYYTKAIAVYQQILAKNPTDQNAKSQIVICQRLRDEYNQANRLNTYTNETYGYSIKLPEYMREGSYNTPEKVSYYSSDMKISVVVSTTIDVSNLSDSQILKNVKNKYRDATITYTSYKDHWLVLSGYLKNGNAFYDKTIISTRQSQYNETVKILVSAVATNSKEETRGSDLAKIIHAHLKVNSSGKSVKTSETDNDRWRKARNQNTQAAYDSYIRHAPYGSSHIAEATARKSILQATNDYTSGRYHLAKRGFETGEKYLTESEKTLYMNSYYNLCIAGSCNLEELNTFVRKFPLHPQMKVIKGCYVKLYCKMGWFSTAKNYVKKNSGVWFSEKTPYTQKQWMQFIKNYNKTNTGKQSTYKPKNTTYGSVGNPVPKYGQKLYTPSIGYSIGVGGELSFPQLYEGAFPQIKVSGAIGDNYNLFNLALDLSIGYSGDYGSTMKAVVAPRWNILPDECFIYVQPEFGYDFLQRGIVYGGRLGIGLDFLGNISVGYQMSEGFGRGLFQLSYVYNWYL